MLRQTPYVCPFIENVMRVRDSDFSDADKRTLKDCIFFARDVIQIVNEMLNNRCAETVLPKFRKSELLELMGKKKASNKLNEKDLHEYLKSKLISGELQEVTMPDISNITQNSTIEQILS
jgi:hypothetical protein